MCSSNFSAKVGHHKTGRTKGADWLRQVRGLVYHPTFLWLLKERFIQEKQILKEVGEERRETNELPIHLLLNNPC